MIFSHLSRFGSSSKFAKIKIKGHCELLTKRISTIYSCFEAELLFSRPLHAAFEILSTIPSSKNMPSTIKSQRFKNNKKGGAELKACFEINLCSVFESPQFIGLVRNGHERYTVYVYNLAKSKEVHPTPLCSLETITTQNSIINDFANPTLISNSSSHANLLNIIFFVLSSNNFETCYRPTDQSCQFFRTKPCNCRFERSWMQFILFTLNLKLFEDESALQDLDQNRINAIRQKKTDVSSQTIILFNNQHH